MAFMDSNLIIADAETIADTATSDTTGYISRGTLADQLGEVYINAVLGGAVTAGNVSLAVYGSADTTFAGGTLIASSATFAAATPIGTVLMAQKVNLAEVQASEIYIGATTTSDATETATVDIWLGMEPAMDAGVSIQNEPS